MILTTLCYLACGDDILMLYRNKKPNDINAGKYIGVGGKFLPNESPDECARREILEETGLVPETLTYAGVVTFLYEDQPAEYMHLFRGTVEAQALADCAEGELSWVPREEVMALALWPGDRLFLPYVLQASHPPFSLKLRYDREGLVEAVLDGVPLPAEALPR